MSGTRLNVITNPYPPSTTLPPTSLETRFDIIANSYDTANANYPNCRTDHPWLLKHARLDKAKDILEVSGGTGFLTTKIAALAPKSTIIVQDVAQAALDINAAKNKAYPNIQYIIEPDMHFPTFKNDQFDSIIGLGGFHHIEDQVIFAKTLNRVLRKGGVACIGDFEDNSSMQRYFDEKVHYITSTGHQGLFASESRYINLARFGGFEKVKVERKKVPFCFANEQEIGDFFQSVHALPQKPEETFEDIKRYFDLIEHPDGIMVIIDYVYACFEK